MPKFPTEEQMGIEHGKAFPGIVGGICFILAGLIVAGMFVATLAHAVGLF